MTESFKFKLGDVVSGVLNGELRYFEILFSEFCKIDSQPLYQVQSIRSDNRMKLWFSENELTLVLRKTKDLK